LESFCQRKGGRRGFEKWGYGRGREGGGSGVRGAGDGNVLGGE